jgi:hypothetical protein
VTHQEIERFTKGNEVNGHGACPLLFKHSASCFLKFAI